MNFRFRRAILVIFVFVSALGVGEIAIRCLAAFEARCCSQLPVSSIINRRLSQIWFGEKDSIMMPPFSAFANRGWDDEGRMKEIMKFATLPPSASWEPKDFLLESKLQERSIYKVFTNALGFRDPERAIEKTPGLFRILAVGDYMTFGHGLSNEDTYPAQLERIMNERRPEELKFEIWNAGVHATTTIMGLARLRSELLKYKPDLIILQFGLVDIAMTESDIVNQTDLERRGADASAVFTTASYDFWRATAPELMKMERVGHSYLAHQALNLFATEKNMRTALRGLSLATAEFVNFCKSQNIRVVLLSQPVLDSSIHAKLSVENGVPWIDAKSIFKRYPPSPEMTAAFDGAETWQTEFKPIPPSIRPNDWFQTFRAYTLDRYQLNKDGQHALALGIADFLIDDLKSHVDGGQERRVPRQIKNNRKRD